MSLMPVPQAEAFVNANHKITALVKTMMGSCGVATSVNSYRTRVKWCVDRRLVRRYGENTH